MNTGPGRSGTFMIVGVGELKGGSGFDNPDTSVYVPLTSSTASLSRSQWSRSGSSQPRSSEGLLTSTRIAPLQQEINDVLMQRHHLSDLTQADFSVTSQEDQLKTRQQVTGVLTIFLGAVAGISLVVGGIGIMNIMICLRDRTHQGDWHPQGRRRPPS